MTARLQQAFTEISKLPRNVQKLANITQQPTGSDRRQHKLFPVVPLYSPH